MGDVYVGSPMDHSTGDVDWDDGQPQGLDRPANTERRCKIYAAAYIQAVRVENRKNAEYKIREIGLHVEDAHAGDAHSMRGISDAQLHFLQRVQTLAMNKLGITKANTSVQPESGNHVPQPEYRLAAAA